MDIGAILLRLNFTKGEFILLTKKHRVDFTNRCFEKFSLKRDLFYFFEFVVVGI